MVKGDIAVIVQEAGQKPTLAIVKNNSTIRLVLESKKMNPDAWAGKVTLNNKKADLSDRVSTGQLVALTPASAGGR